MDDNAARSAEAGQHQGVSDVNGVPTDTNGRANQAAREQAVRQAEEMADRLLERAEYYASWLGRQVMKLAARAKEEAVDIWAEAEYLSRQWQSADAGAPDRERVPPV
jgi:hypothetical protein